MSQKEMVRRHLESGKSITPAKALVKYGIWRLAAVIYKLRMDGMNIKSIKRKSLPYAEYLLDKEDPQKTEQYEIGQLVEVVDTENHCFQKGDVVEIIHMTNAGDILACIGPLSASGDCDVLLEFLFKEQVEPL